MRNPRKIICLDVETTDKDPSVAEILQLSIIDFDGNVLFNHYIKPDRAKFWPGAEIVNHISPFKVRHEQHLDYYHDELDKIFKEADLIVAYNGDHYDIPIIARYGFKYLLDKPSYDVMLEFAPIYGAWNDYHQSYTWQKLATCARYYGYHGDDNFHDSLEDIRATMFCYKKMTEDDENEKLLTKKSEKQSDDYDFDYLDNDDEPDDEDYDEDNDEPEEDDEPTNNEDGYGFQGLAKKVYAVEEELVEAYCNISSAFMDEATAREAVSKPRISLFIYGFTIACDVLREQLGTSILPKEIVEELISAFDEIPHVLNMDLHKYLKPGMSEVWYEQSIMGFGNLRVFAEFFDKTKAIVEEYLAE